MCLSFMVHSGWGGGLVQQKRGREKDGKREGAMFVVGNPLERGNTRVHAHIHTPIYTHTQVQKHREHRHVQENKDLLCMSYRFGV